MNTTKHATDEEMELRGKENTIGTRGLEMHIKVHIMTTVNMIKT